MVDGVVKNMKRQSKEDGKSEEQKMYKLQEDKAKIRKLEDNRKLSSCKDL